MSNEKEPTEILQDPTELFDLAAVEAGLFEIVTAAAAVFHATVGLTPEQHERAVVLISEKARAKGLRPDRVLTAARLVNEGYDQALDPVSARRERMQRQDVLLYMATHLMTKAERGRSLQERVARKGGALGPVAVQVLAAIEATVEAEDHADRLEDNIAADLESGRLTDPEMRANSARLGELIDRAVPYRSRAAAVGFPIPCADGSLSFDGRLARLNQSVDGLLASVGREDYAPGISRLVDRVLHGLSRVQAEDKGLDDEWLWADIREFRSMAARHEFSARDVAAVREALAATDKSLADRRSDVAMQIAELERQVRDLAGHYARGPAHFEALEMQWTAYRVNHAIGQHSSWRGALQPATIAALREAEAYCWASMPVEACAASAGTLRPETALGTETLGPLATPGRCGWWWFQDPVPVKTTSRDGAAEPVVALLWRREIGDDGRARVWFTALVSAQVEVEGQARKVRAPIPTVAWYWTDGVSVGDLEETMRAGYEETMRAGYTEVGEKGKGMDYAGPEASVQACVWFSRFFLAASAWLRQRIVAPTRGEGTRQLGRQLQRQHGLREAPRVSVVHLRQRDSAVRGERGPGEPGAEPDKRRAYSCQWVVQGFWRNQHYPSTGGHQLIYIESYVKGPSDKPLRTKAKVFAVVR